MTTFKPGDVVRRANGEAFHNGDKERTVANITDRTNVWFVETDTWLCADALELVPRPEKKKDEFIDGKLVVTQSEHDFLEEYTEAIVASRYATERVTTPAIPKDMSVERMSVALLVGYAVAPTVPDTKYSVGDFVVNHYDSDVVGLIESLHPTAFGATRYKGTWYQSSKEYMPMNCLEYAISRIATEEEVAIVVDGKEVPKYKVGDFVINHAKTLGKITGIGYIHGKAWYTGSWYHGGYRSTRLSCSESNFVRLATKEDINLEGPIDFEVGDVVQGLRNDGKAFLLSNGKRHAKIKEIERTEHGILLWLDDGCTGFIELQDATKLTAEEVEKIEKEELFRAAFKRMDRAYGEFKEGDLLLMKDGRSTEIFNVHWAVEQFTDGKVKGIYPVESRESFVMDEKA